MMYELFIINLFYEVNTRQNFEINQWNLFLLNIRVRNPLVPKRMRGLVKWNNQIAMGCQQLNSAYCH